MAQVLLKQEKLDVLGDYGTEPSNNRGDRERPIKGPNAWKGDFETEFGARSPSFDVRIGATDPQRQMYQTVMRLTGKNPRQKE